MENSYEEPVVAKNIEVTDSELIIKYDKAYLSTLPEESWETVIDKSGNEINFSDMDKEAVRNFVINRILDLAVYLLWLKQE